MTTNLAQSGINPVKVGLMGLKEGQISPKIEHIYGSHFFFS